MPTPAYVALADLEIRFTAARVAQVFSSPGVDGSDSGVVDTDALNLTIADASAEFDEVAGTVFPMPFAQVDGAWDPAIIEIVSIFVMYRGTALRRPEYSGDGRKLSPYEKEYEKAMKRCKEIKEGKRRLVGVNGAAAAVPANTGGQRSNTNPTGIKPYHYFSPSPTGTGNSGSNGNGF